MQVLQIAVVSVEPLLSWFVGCVGWSAVKWSRTSAPAAVECDQAERQLRRDHNVNKEQATNVNATKRVREQRLFEVKKTLVS